MLRPRALEGGPNEQYHLLGAGLEDSEWGQRTAKGVLPEDIEVGASLQPVVECLRLVGPAAGSSRWAYALRSGVCPARRRARKMASGKGWAEGGGGILWLVR